MCDKITKLREELNAMLDDRYQSPERILEVSRKLDKLIVEYYENMKEDIEKKG